MRIEHAGYQVADPATMANWYVRHLGFTVKRSADVPVPVRFLADASGRVMIEIYRNPKVPVPNYHESDPLLFHIAFVCDDTRSTLERLTAAGATIATPPEVTPAGDELVMLRDPWGIPIQFCRRAQPMV